jgi:hypothetical protein
MANNTGRGTFQKGDPRINRKGKPKDFQAFRELAQQIAHETAQKNGQPIVIEGHVVTVSEAILRQWAASGNPQLQKAFVEVAFGKTPDNADIRLMNIDLTTLSDKQLARLAKGEDVYTVLANPD